MGLRGFLATLGRMLDSCFDESSDWPQTGEGAVATRSVKRRARVDKDLLQNQIGDAVASKRHKSAAAAARSGVVDVSLTGARKHEDLSVRTYFVNTLAELKGINQLSLCFDESIVSCEGTLVTCVKGRGSQRSSWLVPQALGVRMATSTL